MDKITSEEEAFDPYEILQVDKDASQEEIKKSFKKLSKKFHPDKKGGDTRKFQDIAEAYLILGNEENRYLFDIGEYDGQDYMSKIIGMIVEEFINYCIEEARDPIESMRGSFTALRKKISKTNKELVKKIKLFEKYEKNIKNDSKGILSRALDSKIAEGNDHIKRNEHLLNDVDMALDLSKDFELYIPEEEPQDNGMPLNDFFNIRINNGNNSTWHSMGGV